MALLITNECINCSACEPVCPNTAIYEGGTSWSLDRKSYEPLCNDYFFIVTDKCTECVGFHDKPQCAAVCPADCIIIDPDNVESKEELLIKKGKLDLIHL